MKIGRMPAKRTSRGRRWEPSLSEWESRRGRVASSETCTTQAATPLPASYHPTSSLPVARTAHPETFIRLTLPPFATTSLCSMVLLPCVYSNRC